MTTDQAKLTARAAHRCPGPQVPGLSDVSGPVTERLDRSGRWSGHEVFNLIQGLTARIKQSR